MAFNVEALGQPLDDRDALDIAVDAVATLQELLPTWVARNASPEVVYLEAVAQAVAEVIDTGNAVIGAVEEYLLATLYGIPRSPGTPGVGTLTIIFDSTVTQTVPQGSLFLLPDYGIEVAATAAATVTAGTTLAVSVGTTTSTSSLNGISSATIDVVDYLPNVLSVAITTAFSSGSDPEDDLAYITRARNRLARVTNSLVVPDHFTAYALENTLVSNATTISAWDATGTAPAIGAGTDAGHVTVCVYGYGAQVSAGERSNLDDDMTAITAAGVTVHVEEAGLESIDVTCTVTAEPGQVTSLVQANVEAALRRFLNPETWPFGTTVTRDDIRAVILATDGVDAISAMSVPSTGSPDTTLATNEVATAGTLTISVT